MCCPASSYLFRDCLIIETGICVIPGRCGIWTCWLKVMGIVEVYTTFWYGPPALLEFVMVYIDYPCG